MPDAAGSPGNGGAVAALDERAMDSEHPDAKSQAGQATLHTLK